MRLLFFFFFFEPWQRGRLFFFRRKGGTPDHEFDSLVFVTSRSGRCLSCGEKCHLAPPKTEWRARRAVWGNPGVSDGPPIGELDHAAPVMHITRRSMQSLPSRQSREQPFSGRPSKRKTRHGLVLPPALEAYVASL